MFLPHQSDNGALQPWEYLPAAAGTYQVGQLLNVSGGKLAAIAEASATTPAYLCMSNITVAEDEELVPVIRVSKNYIYETKLSAAAASAKVGTKLQVSAGGLEADAAAAGSFEVVFLEATTKGAVVRGRFN